MSKKKESPAMELLRLVWDNEGCRMGPSDRRSSSSMAAALSLAIRYGLQFNIDDFISFGKEFCFDHGEWCYSRVCGTDYHNHGINKSACKAFEKWREREPFILKTSDNLSGRRLAVGSRFRWFDGLFLTVTSFANDGSYLTACAYKPFEGLSCSKCNRHIGYASAKVTRRLKFTVKQLREHNKKVVALHKEAKQ